MAFKLQPGLILGGNVTLSPTGTPFVKDANWSKAATKPVSVGVATNTAFASTSKYDADGSIVTGGTTMVVEHQLLLVGVLHWRSVSQLIQHSHQPVNMMLTDRLLQVGLLLVVEHRHLLVGVHH